MSRSAWVLIVVLGLVLPTGCGGDNQAPGVAQPTTTAPTPADQTFEVEGCPIADAEACALAADVAAALVAGHDETITSRSRSTDFVCDEEVDLPLPACTRGATLTGHPLIDSRPVIEVLDSGAYARQTASILGNVDPTYSDEHGDGAMRVLGVGTCGPDVPERRSYHVAYTAAVTVEDGDVERLVGSYELNLLDGTWLIGTAFLDTYDAWLDAYDDPLREARVQPETLALTITRGPAREVG